MQGMQCAPELDTKQIMFSLWASRILHRNCTGCHIWVLTSNSTGRRQHLSNAVLKLFYLTVALLNIC